MQQSRVRVWELFQYISGPLQGKLADWPANVQDGIMQLVEKKAAEVELPLTILDSCCEIDYGESGAQDKFYIRCFVSEVVAQDIGYEKRLIDAKREVARMMAIKH